MGSRALRRPPRRQPRIAVQAAMMASRLGAIQAKPGDLSPLRIDEALVRKMLVAFLRDEAAKAGFRKAVVNVSGGIDSAAVAYLAAAGYGPENVTELLLGYGTIFGDMASAINPVGDLYKTQLRELAGLLGVPESIRAKVPSADLWVGQTDESELGASYADLDIVLYHMVDRRVHPVELIEAGFDRRLIEMVRRRVRPRPYKRVPPSVGEGSRPTG